MKNKAIFNKVMLVINITLFLLLLTGNSFAFFQPVIIGNDESSNDYFIAGDYKLKLTKLDTISFYGYPGESAETKFTITNTGEKMVGSYTINLSEVINSLTFKDQAYYSITCKSSTDKCESKEKTLFPTKSEEILVVSNLAPNETHTFSLIVGYSLTGDESQSSNNNGELEFKITINNVQEIDAISLVDTILKRNGGITSIVEKGDPLFDNNSSTEMGMYAIKDTNGTSYYYRGSINDNYIEFADLIWRIVRINGDGSIRIILNDYANDENSNIYSLTYNSNVFCKELNVINNSISDTCVDYGNGSYASTSIANTINTWYKNNINGIYENYIKEDSIFCNDYSYIEESNLITYGSSYRLISNKTPDLTCTPISENGSSQKLTLPVGLLSADELALAGAYYNSNDTSHYLYIGSTNWWTMSPSYWDSKNYKINMITSGSISLSRNKIDTEASIRPVINLKNTVMVSGTGLINDPYKVIYY